MEYKILNNLIENVKLIEDKGITFISDQNEEKFVSYKNLYNTVLGILYSLQSKGAKKGDKVIIQIANNENHIYLIWACIFGGIIPVPLAVSNNDENIKVFFKICNLLGDCFFVTEKDNINVIELYALKSEYINNFQKIKNRTIIVSENIFSKHEGVITNIEQDDIAVILFSSGTTGDSKGIPLTHKNILTNLNDIIKRLNITSEDIFISWLPLTHIFGLFAFNLVPVLSKTNVCLISGNLFIQNPILWMDKISEIKATITASPNFGYKYFLSFYKNDKNYNWDFSNLRIILNGGEPISKEICCEYLNEMSKYNLRKEAMFPLWGLTEIGLGTSTNPLYGLVSHYLNRNCLNVGQSVEYLDKDNKDAINFVEVGYVVDSSELKICDDNGNECSENMIGHILIKGQNVYKEYYNNPVLTNKSIDKNGWFHTGDLGFLINGNLILTGRSKDVIFINAKNYYAHDIEKLISKVKGIDSGIVAACGIQDEKTKKDSLIIFVETKKSLWKFVPLAIDIKRYVRNALGIAIEHIIPLETISRSSHGKLQNYKFQDNYKKGMYDNVIEELEKLIEDYDKNKKIIKPRNSIEKKLISIWKEVLGNENISINDNFFEKGGTSQNLVQMVVKVDEQYPGIITFGNIFSYPTIVELAEYLQKNDKEMKILKGITVPDTYYNFEYQGENSFTNYEFNLDGNIYEKLKILSLNVNIKIEDCLFAIYMYYFSVAVEKDIITIHSMLKQENSIRPVTINFNKIESFKELLLNVKDLLSQTYNSEDYLLNKYTNTQIKREDNCIIALVYNKNMYRINSIPQNIYDLILEINHNNNKVSLLWEFNSNKLSKSMINEFINRYLYIIQKLIEEN